MDPVLTASHLSKKYCRSLRRSLAYVATDIAGHLLGMPAARGALRREEFWAVRDVSFSLAPGECLALLGANGSGKSTVLKMLSRVLLPDGGTIRARGRVSAMIELGAGFHPLLTGRENIYLSGAILGMSRREIRAKFDDIVEFAELGPFIDTPVKFYSSGMHVRLGFAIASRLEPDIILIDEVLAVGDVRFRSKCFAHVKRLLEGGTAIVLVSHSMIDVLRTADRGIVLREGQKAFEGSCHDAVNEYQRVLYSSPASERREAAQRGACIEAAATVDGTGRARREFSTGEDIYLQVDVASRVAIDGARLIVAIAAPGMGQVTSISSASRCPRLAIRPGRSRIVLCLRSVPLLKGHYEVTISLYGAGIDDFFDRNEAACRFAVVAPELDYNGYGIAGLVSIDHEWQTEGT